MTPEKQLKEGVRKLIPQRKVRTNKGRRPTVHSKDLGGPRPKKGVDDGSEGNSSKVGRKLDNDFLEDNCNDKNKALPSGTSFQDHIHKRKRGSSHPRWC